MQTWASIFVFAGSVSLFGLVSVMLKRRRGGERVELQRGIRRSLLELDEEIGRLELGTLDAGKRDSAKIRKSLGRLNEKKSVLREAETKIRQSTREEWDELRDEVLGMIDRTNKGLIDVLRG